MKRATVMVVAACGVIITVLSIVFSSELLKELMRTAQPPREISPAPRTVPRTVSMVEQTLIRDDRPGQRIFEEQRAELRRYEWVDRAHGIVRIPIDRAFDILLEEKKR